MKILKNKRICKWVSTHFFIAAAVFFTLVTIIRTSDAHDTSIGSLFNVSSRQNQTGKTRRNHLLTRDDVQRLQQSQQPGELTRHYDFPTLGLEPMVRRRFGNQVGRPIGNEPLDGSKLGGSTGGLGDSQIDAGKLDDCQEVRKTCAGANTTEYNRPSDYFPPAYPFIPHFFTLHELAPHQGKNIRLIMIDTGLAAYTLEKDIRYRRHPDLTCPFDPTHGCLDVTAHDTRTPDTLVFDQTQHLPVTIEDLPGVRTDQQGAAALHGTHAYGIITGDLRPLYQITSAAVEPPPDLTQKISAQNSCKMRGRSKSRDADTHHAFLPAYRLSRADVIMIKAFNDIGHSDKKTLIRAVEKALKLSPDIVLVGLKIDDTVNPSTPSTRRLASLLARAPYVVAAAGNDAEKLKSPRISYPARFAHDLLPRASSPGLFSIGSCGIGHKRARVSPFSQYEPGVGPDFLMPGEHIISTAVPHTPDAPVYAALSGTSTAASLFAGALTLVLGEFKNVFTREHLCHVLRSTTHQPYNTPAWKERSLYGIPDIRMTLFMLHVLKKARPHIKNFEENFTALVKKLARLLIQPARNFCARRHKTSFTKNFMDCVTKSNHANTHTRRSTSLPAYRPTHRQMQKRRNDNRNNNNNYTEDPTLQECAALTLEQAIERYAKKLGKSRRLTTRIAANPAIRSFAA